VQLLGLSEADAAQVIEARDRIGGFSSAEEVIAYTDLSPSLVDGIRERLVFLAITYELTNQPSAQAGGFATAHQNAPGIRCRASTSACNTPTPTPVTAPMRSRSPRSIP
jgi:hypothetical protein